MLQALPLLEQRKTSHALNVICFVVARRRTTCWDNASIYLSKVLIEKREAGHRLQSLTLSVQGQRQARHISVAVRFESREKPYICPEGFDIGPAKRKRLYEEDACDFGHKVTNNVLGIAILLSTQKESKHDAD
jgi:hypothetical protein